MRLRRCRDRVVHVELRPEVPHRLRQSTNVMRVMPSLTIPRSLMFKALDIFGEGLATL